MALDTASVHPEKRDGVLLLTLDDPGGLPRLSRALVGAIHQQILAARAARDILAIVITGTAKAFAVGANIAEVAALAPPEAVAFAQLGQALTDEVESMSKPVIAAIRGYCIGGGFDLAMSCHLRVAATDALFRSPGGALGIVTDWGGTQRLPRIVGRARALELFVANRTLTAEEALRWKLVSRVVAPVDVVAIAETLARKALR